jgi:hypothetical protein
MTSLQPLLTDDPLPSRSGCPDTDQKTRELLRFESRGECETVLLGTIEVGTIIPRNSGYSYEFRLPDGGKKWSRPMPRERAKEQLTKKVEAWLISAGLRPRYDIPPLRMVGPSGIRMPYNPVLIIQRATAEVCGFNMAQIKSRRRERNLVNCRHIGMYLSREMTRTSLPKIGAQFGGRDHTTVLYACRRIKRMLDARDPEITQDVEVAERLAEPLLDKDG